MSDIEFQFIVRKGPRVGQVFPLDARSLIIGRDPMSDIVINDPEISRQHARISQTETGFQIEDLGSTNGTFVEGTRLTSDPYPLEHGQGITMGSGVRLVYEVVSGDNAPVDIMLDTAATLAKLNEDVPQLDDASQDDDEFVLADPSPPPPPPPYEPYAPAEPERYQPEPPQPLVPAGEGDNNNRRNVIIVVSLLLLLCCCCSFFGFMYQWGGDLLLEYLGLLP